MGEAAPLLLLFSLAGGFAFLQYCRKYKHRWDALEWDRNLFEGGLVGAALFLLARAITWLFERLLDYCWGAADQVRSALHSVLPFPYVGSFLGAFALALIVAKVINDRVPEDEAIRQAVQRHCSRLLILLHDAAARGQPVMLTMSNRKVYIGFVMIPPTPKYAYAVVLPTVSGHRDPSTLELTHDTQYWPIYEDISLRRGRGEIVGVKKEDFAITLPLEQICSANLFDDDTYKRYFEKKAGQGAAGTALDPPRK
jgi:hypothetical protein